MAFLTSQWQFTCEVAAYWVLRSHGKGMLDGFP